MLQILVNGKPQELGAEVPPVITALAIVFNPHPMVPVRVPIQQVPKLKAWLNQIINNCTCSHVSYNKVLIATTDCKLFPEGELE